MSEVTVSEGWLTWRGQKTRFFDEKDVEWLKAGNEPKFNEDGFMILPYGHNAGMALYAAEQLEKSNGWRLVVNTNEKDKSEYFYHAKSYPSGHHVSVFLAYMRRRSHNKGYYMKITWPNGAKRELSEHNAEAWKRPSDVDERIQKMLGPYKPGEQYQRRHKHTEYLMKEYADHIITKLNKGN